jgi:hypothetical protein
MGYDKGNANRNQLTALHTYNWLKKHHLSDYIYITLAAGVKLPFTTCKLTDVENHHFLVYQFSMSNFPGLCWSSPGYNC